MLQTLGGQDGHEQAKSQNIEEQVFHEHDLMQFTETNSVGSEFVGSVVLLVQR